MTAGRAICMQMLTVAMNATNNGEGSSPIVWYESETTFTKSYPDPKGSLATPSGMSQAEINAPHAESLTMQFSGYGQWFLCPKDSHQQSIYVDISAEVRIFRVHKGLAWQPHSCAFMQPSLANGDRAYAYLLAKFADQGEEQNFLSPRKFPGRKNWAAQIQLITDGRKEQFLKLSDYLFIKTQTEES